MTQHDDQRRRQADSPSRNSASQQPGTPEHDEWLIDESIEETFPASDSTLPSHPGSSLGTRYPEAAEMQHDTPFVGSENASTGTPHMQPRIDYHIGFQGVAAMRDLEAYSNRGCSSL